MDNALKEIIKDAAIFSIQYDPDTGIRIKRIGKPVDIILLTCFALISTAMQTVKKEKQTASGVREILTRCMDCAFMLYEHSGIIRVDLTEAGRQAQDADQ